MCERFLYDLPRALKSCFVTPKTFEKFGVLPGEFDGYKKRKIWKKEIGKKLLPIAWYPC